MDGSPARQAELMRRRCARVPSSRSSFAGFRFPLDRGGSALVPALGALRDVEELLAERGIEVDQVTTYRYVHRFTALLIDVSARGQTRSSRSSDRTTLEPQPQCAATAWNGSVRPASTSG
jgi:hypothetical protein